VLLNDGEGAPVLIMVSEQRTCSQLKKYITMLDDDHGLFLEKLAHSFFKWRVNIHRMQHSTSQTNTPPQQQQQQQQSSVGRGGGYAGRGPPNKRRRVRGGSATAASGSGRNATLAETFRNDVLETVSS
jgi:DNA excision repair protein ERCC-4